MAAITVRPEPIVRDGDVQTVSAVVSGVTDNPYRIWYRIPCGYEIDDVSLGHALAISVINQAMALGRDVFIDGTLTHGLVANLEEYQHVWSAWRPRTFRVVAIRSRALVEEESYRPQRGVILPFSGGLDSAYSASLLAQSGRLRALFTIQGLGCRARCARAMGRRLGGHARHGAIARCAAAGRGDQLACRQRPPARLHGTSSGAGRHVGASVARVWRDRRLVLLSL
jgi:hypothetical protein